MNRTHTAVLAATLATAAFALPGCIIVGGSSGSNYKGYGSVSEAEFDAIVAANTQNRIGDPVDAVLARYPAEQISLVHSAPTLDGGDVAVYRVYARERYRSASFERFLVFENGTLTLLTDDRDDIVFLEDARD